MKRLLRKVLSPPTMGRERALDLMERTSAVTNLIISAEHLCRPEAREPGGLNNWAITRDNLRRSSPFTRRLLDAVATPRTTAALHAGKIVASALLLSPVSSRVARGIADGVIAGSTLMMYPRHHYGTDGSDQVSFLVQSAAALARAGGSRTKIVDAALWAVAAQATLSYGVSGLVKLAGPSWRGGTALEGITRTLTYGDADVWRAIRRFPKSSRVLGHAVLALECTFPLVYAAGGRLTRTYVASGALFHLANARIMGLGRFLPAFVSMHPALLYTSRSRATTASGGAVGRSDTMVGMFAAAALGVAGAAVATKRINSAMVLAGHGDEQFLTTDEGNRLAYRVRGSTDPDAPLYFFENGMVSTAEHWDWIAEHLAGSATVVTYNRAGYATSGHRKGTAQSMQDLQRDARQLLEHVGSGRKVVLVGHSLGGYLALRVAAEAAVDVQAIALVDSSHPDELRLSEKQAQGQKRLSDTFPMVARSLDLGLGMLLKIPDFLARMPEGVRGNVLAQYRTSKLWHAGRREWAATIQDFDSWPGLPEITVPVLMMSAEHTVEDDEVQGELHERIVEEAPWGVAEMITGADHDSILTDRALATTVAHHIHAFVEQCDLADQTGRPPDRETLHEALGSGAVRRTTAHRVGAADPSTTLPGGAKLTPASMVPGVTL